MQEKLDLSGARGFQLFPALKQTLLNWHFVPKTGSRGLSADLQSPVTLTLRGRWHQTVVRSRMIAWYRRLLFPTSAVASNSAPSSVYVPVNPAVTIHRAVANVAGAGV
jgi:hypothetical protein